MSLIRHLSSQMINQIAAGEVVERPASVLKELVENSLDAKATQIKISLRKGGQSLLRVEDNGCGMSDEDLMLAVQRHTTSKLVQGLESITTFGFRGEALAAMASISRMTLSSRTEGQSHGWTLSFEGGQLIDKRPSSQSVGTCVEVRDLFFCTPARLKFMRSPQVEQSHLVDIVEKFALVRPEVQLTVYYETRKKNYPTGIEARLEEIIGKEFLSHSFHIQHVRDGYELNGYVSLPTYHQATAANQFFFINGRPVKDKIVSACIRAAFFDVIPKDRHPLCVLFMTLPLEEVDVNVHPAKTEVRFKDPQKLRNFVAGTLKQELWTYGQHTTYTPFERDQSSSDTVPPLSEMTGQFRKESTPHCDSLHLSDKDSIVLPIPAVAKTQSFLARGPLFREKFLSQVPLREDHSSLYISVPAEAPELGQAIGQLKKSYILSSNHKGLILVDPHAAHERIVYEKMKAHWGPSLGHSYGFLMAVPLSLTEREEESLAKQQENLGKIGFVCQKEEGKWGVKAIPDIFKAYDPELLMKDLIALSQQDMSIEELAENWRNHIMANWSCRQSLKLGQSLSLQEMNALLRTIEQTPRSASCNHGRCVYRQITMEELARMFDRP